VSKLPKKKSWNLWRRINKHNKPHGTQQKVHTGKVCTFFMEIIYEKHFVETFCGNILWKHFVETFLWKHFCGNILWKHFCGNIFVETFCGNILWKHFVEIIIEYMRNIK